MTRRWHGGNGLSHDILGVDALRVAAISLTVAQLCVTMVSQEEVLALVITSLKGSSKLPTVPCYVRCTYVKRKNTCQFTGNPNRWKQQLTVARKANFVILNFQFVLFHLRIHLIRCFLSQAIVERPSCREFKCCTNKKSSRLM